jgi:uncharacterized membrane protein
MSESHSLVTRPVSISWTVLLGLAIVAGLGFVWAFAVPYLRLDPTVLERFTGRTVWIYSHVALGAVALFTGPPQLWMGEGRRRLPLHRKLGYVYVTVIALNVVIALYLAVTNEVSFVFGTGLGGLAVAWLLTTGMAMIAIRNGRLMAHREWMIRSYVTTMAFVFFRAFVGFTEALGLGSGVIERVGAASWFCWAVPLLLTEVVLQQKRVRQSASRASAG